MTQALLLTMVSLNRQKSSPNSSRIKESVLVGLLVIVRLDGLVCRLHDDERTSHNLILNSLVAVC
jgi:hypothetical protein